jgi:predicted secreted hydrolase
LRNFFLLAVLLLAGRLLAESPFRSALPGYVYSFPRDHGSHPDFKTEWWYFTGNVTDAEGNPFGFKLTIFRSAVTPPSASTVSPLQADQLYIAHFAISDISGGRHGAWEEIGRAGFGQASGSTETLDVRLRGYEMRLETDGSITLKADRPEAGLDLRLIPMKPFAIHGKDGVHQKSDVEGQASHYISFTRLAAEGTLSFAGKKHRVEGLAWMDHEFGSDYLSGEQAGWDWFALQLDSGEDLMLYQLRNKDGTANTHSIGSIVEADGTLKPIDGSRFRIVATGKWRSPESGGTYPMGWRLELPDGELTITPAMLEQEMCMRDYTGTCYWEGAIRIGGTWRGKPASGVGYVELVGYAGVFDLL